MSLGLILQQVHMQRKLSAPSETHYYCYQYIKGIKTSPIFQVTKTSELKSTWEWRGRKGKADHLVLTIAISGQRPIMPTLQYHVFEERVLSDPSIKYSFVSWSTESIRVAQGFFFQLFLPSSCLQQAWGVGRWWKSTLKHLIQSVKELVTQSTAFTTTMLLCPHHWNRKFMTPSKKGVSAFKQPIRAGSGRYPSSIKETLTLQVSLRKQGLLSP